ncbi:MAG: succinate dehydrogenase cytochrome b subunit [Blastochloris sp.]|nr:succinate dehydrogenase cytochrome b subunit [Blastochloris sp.]
MTALTQIFTSSLGRKYIMGITGFGLVGFTIIHMLGNLQIFIGQDTLNAYAKLLKSSAEVLWAFRLALLAMVVLHLGAAISLVIDNRKARGQNYVKEKSLSSWASRTMIISGTIVLAFIVFHILHFTAGVIGVEYNAHVLPKDEQQRYDVYTMVIEGFSNPWISLFYIASVGLLSWHLSHGISSMFQSLGFRNARSAVFLDRASLGLALVIFAGMAVVPTAVLFKWIE